MVRRIGTASEIEVVEELAAQPEVAVRLEEVDALAQRLDRLAVLDAGGAVLLDPRRLLLHLVLGLLQLAPDLLHHLATELHRIDLRRGGRSRGRVGSAGAL